MITFRAKISIFLAQGKCLFLHGSIGIKKQNGFSLDSLIFVCARARVSIYGFWMYVCLNVRVCMYVCIYICICMTYLYMYHTIADLSCKSVTWSTITIHNTKYGATVFGSMNCTLHCR